MKSKAHIPSENAVLAHVGSRVGHYRLALGTISSRSAHIGDQLDQRQVPTQRGLRCSGIQA